MRHLFLKGLKNWDEKLKTNAFYGFNLFYHFYKYFGVHKSSTTLRHLRDAFLYFKLNFCIPLCQINLSIRNLFFSLSILSQPIWSSWFSSTHPEEIFTTTAQTIPQTINFQNDAEIHIWITLNVERMRKTILNKCINVLVMWATIWIQVSIHLFFFAVSPTSQLYKRVVKSNKGTSTYLKKTFKKC